MLALARTLPRAPSRRCPCSLIDCPRCSLHIADLRPSKIGSLKSYMSFYCRMLGTPGSTTSQAPQQKVRSGMTFLPHRSLTGGSVLWKCGFCHERHCHFPVTFLAHFRHPMTLESAWVQVCSIWGDGGWPHGHQRDSLSGLQGPNLQACSALNSSTRRLAHTKKSTAVLLLSQACIFMFCWA